MDQNVSPQRKNGPRHSILDLAPLELECMSALWPQGEATVRDIHRHLAESRPRAYTTIMTIMDRLAHKGIVTRSKVGRAYFYRATLSADEARESAIQKIITGFFGGSTEALAAHLRAAVGPSRSALSQSSQLSARSKQGEPNASPSSAENSEIPESPKHVPVDIAVMPGKQSLTR